MGVLLAVLLIGSSIHQAVHLGGVCQLHLKHPSVCKGVTVDLQPQEMQFSAAISICELQARMAISFHLYAAECSLPIGMQFPTGSSHP